MQSSSPFGKLNLADVWKTVRGGFITFGAAFLIEVLTALQTDLKTCQVSPSDCQVDLGAYVVYIPTVITVLGMLLELTRRYVTNYQK
jgi:hypothetical protein